MKNHGTILITIIALLTSTLTYAQGGRRNSKKKTYSVCHHKKPRIFNIYSGMKQNYKTSRGTKQKFIEDKNSYLRVDPTAPGNLTLEYCKEDGKSIICQNKVNLNYEQIKNRLQYLKDFHSDAQVDLSISQGIYSALTVAGIYGAIFAGSSVPAMLAYIEAGGAEAAASASILLSTFGIAAFTSGWVLEDHFNQGGINGQRRAEISLERLVAIYQKLEKAFPQNKDCYDDVQLHTNIDLKKASAWWKYVYEMHGEGESIHFRDFFRESLSANASKIGVDNSQRNNIGNISSSTSSEKYEEMSAAQE